ncbi:hypothetical protein Pcinc_000373 [Petrolisthes cinctipes]|uniref:Uncharacterized protein n=1 Tax=Petrolisthes cinctipes TaxID=88211 RepID=A0AAE1L455_PETCI|nr:hypothetical protein Pcinc_000373 [Petrolisthes cinctipes]
MNIIRRNYQPLYIHFSKRFVGDSLLTPPLARLHHPREEEDFNVSLPLLQRLHLRPHCPHNATRGRSRVMGEANMFAKLGSSCSPYINDIFGEVLVWGPSAVFSLATLAAAFIVTLLPETKNKIMAQGIDDQPEHVMEHVPSRPQHDPPRTQYDPLRTQYDPSTTQT